MIKIYEGNYDKSEFYSKMGKFFAEKIYTKQMPYIYNSDEKVWFVIEENNLVVAFSSMIIKPNKIELTTAYVEKEHRGKGLFKQLTDVRLEFCKDKKLPIYTTTEHNFIKEYFEKRGFNTYKKTKNYFFLVKE